MEKSDSNGRKILIVEDERSIYDVCRRVLTGEGLEIDIAVNGRVAQTMIREKHYDLCLIDIRTPVISGKELYQWLQERHPQLTKHVVFTTGDLLASDTKSFLEGSSRPFLPKPFSPDDLKAIVKEAL